MVGNPAGAAGARRPDAGRSSRAVSIALAVQHRHRAGVDVDVLRVESEGLGEPQAAPVEQGDQRPLLRIPVGAFAEHAPIRRRASSAVRTSTGQRCAVSDIGSMIVTLLSGGKV
jgi:hypothetical protein